MNFLFVGRIAPNKKIEDHIRLAEHYKRYVDAYYRFIFVGRYDVVPRYYSTIRALMSEYRLLNERFIFTGPVPDEELAVYYRHAAVYISLSEHEGFCAPLLEAMAADVPVLAYARRRGARNARRRRRAVRAEGSRVRRRARSARSRSTTTCGRRSSPASGAGWPISATPRIDARARRAARCIRTLVMKIAFIVQRYGTEVLGGSEHLCRLVAERLAGQHDVEVLTTCARDYVTWKNDIRKAPTASAASRSAGSPTRARATSRRSTVLGLDLQQPAQPRRRDGVAEAAGALVSGAHRLPAPAPAAVRRPDLLHVSVRADGARARGRARHERPRLRPPTTSRRSGSRSSRTSSARPAALCYLTESERQFVQRQFPDRPLLEEVVGVGVDIPQQQPYPRMPPPPTRTAPAGEDRRRAGGRRGRRAAREFPSHLLARGAVFRRRHRLYGPIVLYGGRIDPGKGCEELIEYFSGYVKEGGDATLALMGAKLMALPEEPFIRFAGLLSDRERLQALEAATVVVCPSPYESLSLLALEALSVGTPVLANARSAVLVEHCVRSNGGLYYADRDEFVECLKLLVGDARLRAALGRNGRDYVRRNYRWDVVLGKYERIFAKVRNAR